jgi:hypothetical protein
MVFDKNDQLAPGWVEWQPDHHPADIISHSLDDFDHNNTDVICRSVFIQVHGMQEQVVRDFLGRWILFIQQCLKVGADIHWLTTTFAGMDQAIRKQYSR